MNQQSSTKDVTRKRKRIRSLASSNAIPDKKSNKHFAFFGILAIVLGFTAFLWRSQRFREELKHVAMNQFHLMIYGREDYCNESFEHWHIENLLRHRIIGQENAIQELAETLQQHQNVSAIGFFGSQGVGKTLTLNLIQNKFQWHLNTQQYIWSLIQSPHDQLSKLLRLMNGLTTCGQNGIFVDNVPLEHFNIIDEFNRKLLAYSNENHIKLIVIYVFQSDNPNLAGEQLRIDNVKSIKFRQFNSHDIRNCINMESERLKINVTPQQMNELLADIDAKDHGCKNVAARIARQDIPDF